MAQERQADGRLTHTLVGAYLTHLEVEWSRVAEEAVSSGSELASRYPKWSLREGEVLGVEPMYI